MQEGNREFRFYLSSIRIIEVRGRVISIRLLSRAETRGRVDGRNSRTRDANVVSVYQNCLDARHRGSIHPSFQIITSCLARNPKMLNFRFDEKFHSLLKCYFWRSGRRRNVKFKSYVYFGGSRII